MYNIYLKRRVREVILAQDLSLESAIAYCKGKQDLIIKDAEGNVYTKEELKNAKSFVPESRTQSDSELSGGGAVSKDTSSKLSWFDRDRTE